MARFTVGVLAGIVITVVAGAALGIRAAEDTSVAEAHDMGAGADLTGVDGSDQAAGAADVVPDLTVGSPRAQQRDWIDVLIDCLARHESQNSPSAYNRSSGASGLLQFLPSTWRSTPQGRAGASIWDPAAQRAAGRYMIGAGRLHEWSTWRMCA